MYLCINTYVIFTGAQFVMRCYVTGTLRRMISSFVGSITGQSMAKPVSNALK